MKIDDLINQVLVENNSHWLNKDQAEHSISEGRLTITKKDVHDIIKKLPIRVYGNDIFVEIDDEGVFVSNLNINQTL